MSERMSANEVIMRASMRWYGANPLRAAGFGGFVLEELKANGYAVIELPEPDEQSPFVVDGSPKILARWDGVETGEVTVWEGCVVDVFGQTMLSPEDALTFGGVIVRASQIAAAAAAEHDARGGIK